MKRRLNKAEIALWRERVGGLKEATVLIKATLKCSESKAQKLATGLYPSVPTPLEQDAIAALLKRPLDSIFPSVERAKRAKAS